MNADPNSMLWVAFLLAGMLCFIFYFIPSIVAFGRRQPHRWFIFLLNLSLGGSGIGWIAALIWSFYTPKLKTEN